MTGALRGGEVALVFSAVRLAAPSVLAGPFLCQLVAAAKSWRRLSAARSSLLTAAGVRGDGRTDGCPERVEAVVCMSLEGLL